MLFGRGCYPKRASGLTGTRRRAPRPEPDRRAERQGAVFEVPVEVFWAIFHSPSAF